MKQTDEARLMGERYELRELVGAGGMAEVWRARDMRLERDVAVKVLSGPSARSASMRRRLEREARALASLSHPSVVAVYDYGEDEDGAGVRPYIAMELVEGRDLHHKLAESGALSAAESVEILTAVLGAVESAHLAGIVHGDLKPANIILGPDGAKVGDFGVARILAEETGTTTVAATPSFAAPEVLRGDRPSPASDIYSVGCVAFHMLAGRPPYEGTNAWEVAAKHLEDPIPDLGLYRPGIPPALTDAVRRALSKNPARRYESASDFIGALASVPLREDVTVPDVHASGAPQPTATEVLPGRPDLGAVAFLGPLAELGGWLRERSRRVGPRLRRSPLGAVLALAVMSVLVLAVLLSGRGAELVAVPDVRGKVSAVAGAELRAAGLSPDVSFRPVTSGTPDLVLESIPEPGTGVEPGSRVHLVASALVQPQIVSEERGDEGRDEGRGRDGGKERGDKDDD